MRSSNNHPVTKYLHSVTDSVTPYYMSQFTVWIVSPPNYQHSAAFADVAQSLNAALIELGYNSRIVTSSFECRGRTIILGANLLQHMPAQDLPKDFVIWNLEQIFPGSPWLSNAYLDLLRGIHDGYQIRSAHKMEVWDYSHNNIIELSKLGIDAKLVQIGYMPCLTNIEPATYEYDVLHIGSITQRRIDIINALAHVGVKMHYAFGVYGKQRDELIAKSKIIINVHFYEAKRFEIVRCSHLMANKKCIVSEISEGGEPFHEGIAFTDYDGIVSRCLDLLGDDNARNKLAQSGFDIFSKMRQTDYLREVL